MKTQQSIGRRFTSSLASVLSHSLLLIKEQNWIIKHGATIIFLNMILIYEEYKLCIQEEHTS